MWWKDGAPPAFVYTPGHNAQCLTDFFPPDALKHVKYGGLKLHFFILKIQQVDTIWRWNPILYL